MLRAPIWIISTPRLQKQWDVLAVHQLGHNRLPRRFAGFGQQVQPFGPQPWKLYGLVRGLNAPPRSSEAPPPARGAPPA